MHPTVARLFNPIALMALAGLIAAALLVTVARGAGDPGATARSAPSSERPVAPDAGALKAAARAELGALRGARQPAGDAIALDLASSPLLADGLVDLASSRRVQAGAGSAWLASSRDGRAVCAVSSAGGAMCPLVESLVANGLEPGVMGRAGEPLHVWGIAGDDVEDVVLELVGGRRVPVTVADNFFDVETSAWPSELTWEDEDGPHSFAFPARSG